MLIGTQYGLRTFSVEGRHFEQVLRVDRPPPSHCFAIPNRLAATQGAALAVPKAVRNMEFKLKPLEAPSDQPFQFDRLNREQSVATIKTLIQNLSGFYVIAVDSPWGTGKTTFLRFLQAVLEKDGVDCLYFDAWKTDFSPDPLLAFLGELNDHLPVGAADHPKFTELFLNVKRIASVLAKRAIPVAGKIATAGMLNREDFTEQTLSEFAGNQLHNAVDSYNAAAAR